MMEACSLANLLVKDRPTGRSWSRAPLVVLPRVREGAPDTIIKVDGKLSAAHQPKAQHTPSTYAQTAGVTCRDAFRLQHTQMTTMWQCWNGL